MDCNEVYAPPKSTVEEKRQEAKTRKFVMAIVGFLSSYLGIMLFFLTGEIVFNAEPANFIFETGFQIATGICSLLTAALLYPIRSIAWYFHVLIASIAGLAILFAVLFALNEITS